MAWVRLCGVSREARILILNGTQFYVNQPNNLTELIYLYGKTKTFGLAFCLVVSEC